MEEVWKDVKGFDGIYQVSNLGNIRSVKLMKPRPIWNGYMQISFYKDGIEYHRLVHRVVAEAFLENSENLPQVNHKDENKKNNRADNLEWCTRNYNKNYGTGNKRSAEKRSKRVLQFTLDWELIEEHPSLISIERNLGYDHSTIAKCCNRKKAQAYGYRWKYA